MENNPPETLINFLTEVVGSAGAMWNEEISPERAIISAQQYPYLRSLLVDNQERLASSRAKGAAEFKRALAEIFQVARDTLMRQLTHLATQEKDQPLSPQEVAQRAVYWQRAAEKENGLFKGRFDDLQKKRDEFCRTLVPRWVKTLRERRLYAPAEALAAKQETISRQLNKVLTEAVSGDTLEQTQKTLEGSLGAALNHLPETRFALEANPRLFQQVLSESLASQPGYLKDATSVYQTKKEISRTILAHPEIIRTDHLTELLAANLEAPGVDPKKAQAQAVKLTRVAQALGSTLPPEDDLTATGHVFQALFPQQPLAPWADRVLSTFKDRRVREAIVENVLVRSWEPTIKALPQRFGKAVVNTQFFQNLLRQRQDSLPRAGTEMAFAGAARVVSDIFGSILRGPNEIEISILEIQILTRGQLLGATLDNRQVVTAALYRGFPELFGFNFLKDLGGFGLRLVAEGGAKKLIQRGASAATQKASQGFFSRLVGFLFGKAGAGAGLVGGPVGAIIGFIVGSLIAPLFRGIGSLLGKLARGEFGPLGTATRAFKDFFGAGGAPAPDRSWIGPAVLVGVLALLLIFPSFLGLTHVAETSRTSPLPLSVGGGLFPTGEPPCTPGVDPECAVAFCNPATRDCRWPTPVGCITQGPYDGPGNTHANLNAIDIAGGGTHIDVTATHDGVVEQVVSSFRENQFVPRNYGNYVLLRGTDRQGKTFYTLYAHLWIIAEYRGSGRILQPGDQLRAGEPIGKTNNNGTSYGEHLHYEYRGGGEISTILPQPVPRCAYGTCPAICW